MVDGIMTREEKGSQVMDGQFLELLHGFLLFFLLSRSFDYDLTLAFAWIFQHEIGQRCNCSFFLLVNEFFRSTCPACLIEIL